jgi:hypothetical protein
LPLRQTAAHGMRDILPWRMISVRLGYDDAVLRLGWPTLILGTALVILLARRPGLLFSRAFFPVLLVAGIFLLVSYRRRPRRRRGGPVDQ